eukprot:gene4282-5356_t
MSNNNNNNVEILESDQAFIDQEFGPLGGLFGEEITCQCPVFIKIGKDLELKPRILVVGKYKIMFIKKLKFGNKKVKQTIHLYDILEISENTSDTIEIKYKDQVTNSLSTFLIRAPTRSIETIIIKTIAITSYAISKGFPPSCLLKINLPNTRFPSMTFDHDFGAIDGKGIAEQYIAHSHYFKRKATLDYLRHLETLFTTRYPQLDFSQIPGIDASCSLGFNLFTSIITLRHNPFIKSLKITNVPHINVCSSVGEMMQTNSAITELIITNLLTEQSFTPIGHALMVNDNSALQTLNLSNNMLSYESVVSICEGLASFNHSLVTLDLSKCNIPPKGVTLLFEAFERNFAMSLTLENLILSDNRFQDSGSNAFASWLSKSRGHNSLRKLVLSQTQLNFSIVGPPLRVLTDLETLDVSKNKITQSHARILSTELIECVTSWKHLNLSGCGIVADSLQMILISLGKNRKFVNLNLNLSNNNFATKSCGYITQLLPECTYIYGLDLSSNNFTTRQCVDILQSLSKLKNLVSIDIGNNSYNSNDDLLVSGILEYLSYHPNTIHLGIGSSIRALGPSLHPLIQSLYSNKSLTVLDIFGNEMNDHGACLLADCLRNNKTLKKINLLGNKFTSVGWQSLSSPFIYYRNTTLCHLDLPNSGDIILQSDSNQVPLTPSMREKLDQVFNQMRLQLSLNSNKVPSSSRYAYLPPVDPPIYVKPPSKVPEHLSPASEQKVATINLNTLRIGGGANNNNQNGKPSISSIFSKPLNTLINITNDIRGGTVGNNGDPNNTHSDSNQPSSWNDDEKTNWNNNEEENPDH